MTVSHLRKALTMYLYSAHRAVIFAIARHSCFTVCWTNRAVSITCYLISGRTLLRINCVIHPFSSCLMCAQHVLRHLSLTTHWLITIWFTVVVSTHAQWMCYVFIVLYNCVYFVFFCKNCMFLIQPSDCNIINKVELRIDLFLLKLQ